MKVKLDIPFQQLLRIIRQLTPSQRKKVQSVLEAGEESVSKCILAFGGAFAGMNKRDYAELTERLKDTRAGLFDRGTTAPC